MNRFSSIISLLLLWWCAGFTQPKLHLVGGSRIDCGTILQGNHVVKALVLKNLGNDTLLIDDIEPTCGCTTIDVVSKEIVPNDSIILRVIIDTREIVGRTMKELYISSNDSLHEDLTVKFYVTVIPLVEVRPDRIDLNTIQPGYQSVQSILIQNNSDDSIRIISINVPDSQLTVSTTSHVIKEHGSIRVMATFLFSKPGSKNGTITIETDNPVKHEILIPYEAYIQK